MERVEWDMWNETGRMDHVEWNVWNGICGMGHVEWDMAEWDTEMDCHHGIGM